MSIALRSTFPDLNLLSMLPFLVALTDKERANKTFPPAYPDFMRVMNSSRAIEQDTGLGALGQMVQVGENGVVQYDSIVADFPATYTMLQYNLGYELSYLVIADDKFGVAETHAQALGRSGRTTPDVIAASVLNNGFDAGGSFNGPDGKPLFSATHLMRTGITQSNRPTASVDFNIPALKAALIAMNSVTDDRGTPVQITPRRVIGPKELEFDFSEILGGTMQARTADNTINAFRNRIGFPSFTEAKTNRYLTNTRAWFVFGDVSELGLKLWWRERFNQLSKTEFENRSLKVAAWMRLCVGWSWWQASYGSPGLGN